MVRHSRRLVFTPERLPPFFGRPGRDLPRAQSATDDITEDARDNPAESRVNFTELGLPFRPGGLRSRRATVRIAGNYASRASERIRNA